MMLRNLLTTLSTIKRLSIIKSLFFNFSCFPIKIAIRFPVYVYRSTILYSLAGKIVIEANNKDIYRGMIKLGVCVLGAFDKQGSKTTWGGAGIIVFKGPCVIGRGCRISVDKDAVLTFGSNMRITGYSDIICVKSISFGDKCLISWDVLVMDSDFHKFYNDSKKIINQNRPIYIGEHVWIGCRSTILKGVEIADNNIIASGSMISKSIFKSNCIIGGSGTYMNEIKSSISWEA